MSSYIKKSEWVKTEISDKVGWVKLCHENPLNPLSAGFVEAIYESCKSFDEDPSVKCIVLIGSEKAFAAGADLKEMLPLSFAKISEIRYIEKNWSYFSNIQKPIIAAVNGFALGGGCELAMSCDFIIASEDAKFGQPEINVGAIPGAGGSQRMPRYIGKSKAMYAILTGDMIDAYEAEKCGLVAKVFTNDEFMQNIIKISSKIASKSSALARLAKESVNLSYETPLQEGLRAERSIFMSTFALEDHTEGMTAFAEKRKPDWKDK